MKIFYFLFLLGILFPNIVLSQNVIVKDFTTRDGERNKITRKLTYEFEEALFQYSEYVVMEYRNKDRLLSTINALRKVQDILKLPKASLDNLKDLNVDIIVFGEFFDDIEDGNASVRVTFQELNGRKLLIKNILIPRGRLLDQRTRIEKMAELVKSFDGGGSSVTKSSKLDLPTAIALLDRAIKAKDGSRQGQVAAIETLLAGGFSYENASFDGVSLTNAVMHGANFSSSSFIDGDLSNAEFDRGDLKSANFNFANLQNTSFRNVKAKETYFQYTSAESAHFEGATLDRSSFFLSRLPRAKFNNANLQGASLAFCDLTGADFSGADLTDAIIYASVLDGANFKGATIKNTDIGASVANIISFSPTQRNELRRSAPLVRYLDIKIWGHAQHTDEWTASYPDFNSYHTKLVEIPQKLSASLNLRNDNALQPVGVFRRYDSHGPNDIRAYHWFDVEFWEQGSRSKRIKERLKDYGEFLFKEIGRQALIEGSGQDLSQSIKPSNSKLE